MKGFTLIELLVAVGIVGILTAMSFIAFEQFRRRANDTVAISHLQMLNNSLKTFQTSELSKEEELSGAIQLFHMPKSGWTISLTEDYAKFNAFGITRLLPGYVLNPNLYINTFLHNQNTNKATTSHCLGSPNKEFPDFTQTFYRTGGSQTYKEDINTYLKSDGSDCP